MKGYTSTSDLATYMGLSFNAGQSQMAAIAIGAAEAWIDNNTKHAWLEVGPITEAVLMGRGNIARVAKPPVKEFTGVSVVWWLGGTSVALDGTCGQFQVKSLRDGEIYVPMGAYAMQVVYLPTDDDVPDEVVLSTNILAAATLRTIPSFNDDVDPTIVQRYVIGGELEVEFRKNVMTSTGAVAQAQLYLDTWLKGYTVV